MRIVRNALDDEVEVWGLEKWQVYTTPNEAADLTI